MMATLCVGGGFPNRPYNIFAPSVRADILRTPANLLLIGSPCPRSDLRPSMSPHRAARFWIVELFCCALVVAVALPAHAQTQAPLQQPPAYIAALDGDATLDRGGDVQPALVNMPLVAGDRLRTTGRAEIRFPDGTG